MLIFIKHRIFRHFTHMHLKYYNSKATFNLIEVLKKMPKEPKHIAEAQRHRKKIKEKYSKYVPSRVILQVLGTGAPGAPCSLYIFSDQSRYLFNCGEGTQRLAHEHKMKLARLEHIFITQPVWRNIGGLPGTALTIQDVGVPQVTLHGPRGLEELFTATKRFVIIRDLKIQMADCSENSGFEDNVMKVQYVPLKKSANSFSDDEEVVEPNSDNSSKEVQVGSNGILSDASTSTRSDKKRRRNSRARSVSQNIEIVEDDTDYYAHERKRGRNRHRSRSRSRTVSGNRSPSTSVSQTSQLLLEDVKEKGISMAYICKLQPRPGTLILEKCVDFGVPPGPLLGKLKSGEDVTLENGTVVRSADVCEPNDPGPVFIVVDCPSEDYFDSLVNNQEFRKHQAEANCDEDVATLVVHFTPKDVLEHPRYKQWVNQFSPSTQHLVLNDANNCMGSVAVHRIQYKLNLLSNEIFPLLGDGGTEVCEANEGLTLPVSKKMKCEFEERTNGCGVSPVIEDSNGVFRSRLCTEGFSFANTISSFHLRPKKGLDRSSEIKLVPAEYLKETFSVEGFSDALRELKQKLSLKTKDLTIKSYPKIVFLGTGSCIPNKTRNTSGILVQTSEESYMLLDCGEGTFGQVVRFFGKDKANDILSNINAIYVSHLHADHHIGLIGVLKGRRRAANALKRTRNPILLFAPKQILTWLNFYDRCFENVAEEFELVSNVDLLLDDEKLSQGIKLRICNTLGLKNINTVYVKHCPNAFGVSFTHVDGYKITYSGDTMPCDSLIKLGMNSDVLIHEATMEDELAHEAIIKMHSTTSQAIEIGKLMQAKNILLTHFSQRYAKLPRFNENFDENIGIAFDNMQVRLDELSLVPLFYPALRLMFAEHYEELENKAVKRQLRIEREREASRERQLSADKHKETV